MIFAYRTLLSQLRRSLTGTRGTNRRITAKRMRFFAVFAVLFTYGQISSWICLALDHLLYPRFRRVDLSGKILIILGNFRSGSTFLHRMLAADQRNFTAFTTWEIYLAPSIVQRKILKGWKIVDSWFGAPLYRRLRGWDEQFLQSVPLHRISLWKPEEDVGLLLYTWYSLFSWFFFPDWEPIQPIVRFDHSISAPRRKRIIDFYAGCVKRHLFMHGADKIVVSKNPSFSPLIDSLNEHLPSPRFIGLVRNPADTVASTIGWLSFAWHFFADPIEEYPFSDHVIEMVRIFYESIRRGEALAETTYRTIRFDTLVGRTSETVSGIYEFVRRPLSKTQQEYVAIEAEAARKNTPDARTRLEIIGIDPRWLSEVFRDTIAHYGFGDNAVVAGPIQTTGSEDDVGISTIRAVD